MTTGHSENYAPSPDNRHSLLLILTVLLLVFFFLGFFSLYFCRYLANVSWLHHQSPNTRGAQALPSSASLHSAGLHPSIISSFPIFSYALVKDHRRGKCGLECAVCLSEFSDDDVLRLLTVCNHAFHPDCIDPWFASHTTCPVCRQNLDPADESTEKTPEVRVLMPESDVSNETIEDEEVVMVAREESEQRSMNSFKEGRRGEEEGCSDADMAFERCEKGHVVRVDCLQRSHSTGHSLLEEDDRYTLRLPENVKERIIRERNCTKSCCIVFGGVSDSAPMVAEERSNVSPS